tara:strand:+ start:357 stop:701 length:345 start_codon:yes stop_codon:yes gene_type:complete
MNRLIVLCKKVPDNNLCVNSIIRFSNDLSKTSKKFDGFITTQSYWQREPGNQQFDLEYTNKLYTISNWEDVVYWNKWWESEERKEVCLKHNLNIKSEVVFLNKTIDLDYLVPLL